MGTKDLVTAYLGNGGAVSRVGVGETNGMRKRDWDRAIRGEVEQGVVTTTELASAPRISGKLKLRCGFGSK
jgi:hypothetical protein